MAKLHISPDKLYTIDRAIRTALRINALICFLLLIGAALDSPLKHYLTYALLVTAIICGVLIVCRICLSPFVKSDEQEEFEEKLDYVLAHREGKKNTQPITDNNYTPLRNLTPEQEVQIKQLLRDLPSHEKKSDAIKLALVVQYLKALENLDKANLTDLYNLRLWVGNVTGKNVPESSQFNEAIRDCAKSKVSKAQKDIMRFLQ